MKGDVLMQHSLGTFTTDGKRIFHRITGVEIPKPAFIFDINSGHTFYIGDIYDCYKRMSCSRLHYPYAEIFEFENSVVHSSSPDIICTAMNYFNKMNDNQARDFLRKDTKDIKEILAVKMQEGY